MAVLENQSCFNTEYKPPKGWNSYDYYDTSVTEAQVLENARFMAKHLKAFTWEYVVVDIQWYARNAGKKRDQFQYIPFEDLEIDAYSRLQPCPVRFPSSAGAKGFKALADQIHELGLKFGLHIMRGIPRLAAHKHSPILGSDVRADEIADPSNICFWNPDMYGLRPEKAESQVYYDSLFAQYASWGVDFIKCDDICRMDMPSAKAEIAMLNTAIKKSGRPMILSLSPGPAKLEEAWHYARYANMWRISDDFWDSWPALLHMFELCERWQFAKAPGAYPDCDMLPLGRVGKGFGQERDSNFNPDEQRTMLSLWCICGSPLILGTELPSLDPETLKMLQNKEIMALSGMAQKARQLVRNQDYCVWKTQDPQTACIYMAIFNFTVENPKSFVLKALDCGLETFKGYEISELWEKQVLEPCELRLEVRIPSHGVRLLRLDPFSKKAP